MDYTKCEYCEHCGWFDNGEPCCTRYDNCECPPRGCDDFCAVDCIECPDCGENAYWDRGMYICSDPDNRCGWSMVP